MDSDATEKSQQESSLAYEISYEKPKSARQTLRRLWKTSEAAHGRFLLVFLSVLCYTGLMIAAPWYSAGIVNQIWENIKASRSIGEAFTISWQQGREEILILLLLYLGAWVFYTFQSYAMLTFAEKLNLSLRTSLSEKLSRLPLSYYDKNRTGSTLSRFTNDLDKMSEALQNGILDLFQSIGMVIGSRS